MTQAELAEHLSRANGLSVETSKKFAELFFQIIRRELKNSDSFSVHGFGTFKKNWIEESRGINPQTGESIVIPAHYRIKFVPAAAVARRINKPYAHLKAKPINEKNRKPFLKILSAIGLVFLVLVIFAVLAVKSCSSSSVSSVSNSDGIMTVQEIHAEEPSEAEDENIPSPDVSEMTENPVPAEIEEKEVRFREYTVQPGSSYHLIAASEFGNRHLWPFIYAVNSSEGDDPDILEKNSVIIIPEVESAGSASVKASMMKAFRGYLGAMNLAEDADGNQEKRRLAAGVLTSAEVVFPGFIDEFRDEIPSYYADYARGILSRNYPSR